MQEQRFYFLISRLRSGNATGDEQAELQRLIRDDEGLYTLYCELFPEHTEPVDENSEALQAYTAHYTRMQLAGLFEEQAPVEKRRFGIRSYMAVAALLAVLAAGAWFFRQQGGKSAAPATSEVKTQKGNKSNLTLPDGTEVWLNGNSKLVYNNDFNETHRNVILTGEAYFKAAQNSNMPFIIQANGLKVKVLGTVFCIRSYPDETNVETMLVSGAIEVTLDDQPGNTIQLKPGQKLSVRSHMQEQENKTATTPLLLLSTMRQTPNDSSLADVAWIEDKLVFDGDAFDKVVSKIEKWYNVAIVVENQNLYSSSFTGMFTGKPLATVLNTLQATGKLTYNRVNDTVYVR